MCLFDSPAKSVQPGVWTKSVVSLVVIEIFQKCKKVKEE
jgi:hypothetical protein